MQQMCPMTTYTLTDYGKKKGILQRPDNLEQALFILYKPLE